jgi:hypothetical protein
MGVLARVPFEEESLTGRFGTDTKLPEGDFRPRHFRGDRKQQLADHVEAILDDLGIERDEPAEWHCATP